MSDTPSDVVIVGGGLCGLRLASLLQQAGREWQLLEARDRIGGRVLSPKEAGTAIDLGPAWFWPGQPRMAALAQDLGLQVFEQYATGMSRFEDAQGRIAQQSGFASMEGALRIASGMGAITDALTASLPQDRLHTARHVTKLRREGDRVIVESNTQAGISTRHVVLALPPRLMAAITCSPALPAATLQAMQAVPTWMAGQAKAVALYDCPFWRGDGLSGDAFSQRGPMVEIHDATPPQGGGGALFGFIGVPPAQRADEGALREACVAQFVRLFGPAAGNPVSVILKDWAQDPATATAADLAPLHSHPRYGALPSPGAVWEGALHFSGTETSPAFGGFLEGALEAAEADMAALTRAAHQDDPFQPC